MRKLLCTAIFVLLVSGIANAVPYPYREYTIDFNQDLKSLQDKVWDEYTVPVGSDDGDTSPWAKSSKARIYTAEYHEIGAYIDAAYELWTDKELQDELDWLFRTYVDNTIDFGVSLMAEKPGVAEREIVNTSEDNSTLRRFVLETDTGARYTPVYRWSGTPDIIIDRMWSFSSLRFPRYDGDVQIINKDTKWIRLWYITDEKRVYFQFDFE